MAPAAASQKPTMMGKNGSSLIASTTNSREVTPTEVKSLTMAKGDAEVNLAYNYLVFCILIALYSWLQSSNQTLQTYEG